MNTESIAIFVIIMYDLLTLFVSKKYSEGTVGATFKSRYLWRVGADLKK
jgi:hypothetical protein